MSLDAPSDSVTLSPNANYGIAITVQSPSYSLYALPDIEEYIKYIVLDFRCAWVDIYNGASGYGSLNSLP
ncbi:hypothetical protein TALC_00232 [Thermoplasmatales archaeon BRNA1]|nr:hypothetical protein TALC_00232 [Thermoplasmatales archaeon BRNA1]